MLSIDAVVSYLEAIAPRALAEEWDNVGLLLGDRARAASGIMTCLTITPATADEAVQEEADLVVTHHPLPFRPLRKVTADGPEGRLLWTLATAGISVYSAHTAFDSARDGINQRWAEGIGLANVQPLVTKPGIEPAIGAARWGSFPTAISLREVASRAQKFVHAPRAEVVGELDGAVTVAAVACGSGAEFLEPASERGCQVLITGEARFHKCLEAEALGMGLVLVGHYASERFGVEHLADLLGAQFPAARVWASARESDPLQWIE